MTAEMVSLSRLDAAFLELDALLHDADRARALRAELIADAFRFHVDRNADYRRYVERCGVDPDGPVDAARIPLLPSAFFKRENLSLASVEPDAIVKYCTSSGTSGSRSVVPRDDITLTRFLGSVTATIPPLFGLDRTGEHRGLVLGPTAEEAGDLWFSYVLAGLTLVMDTEHLEHDGRFSAALAAERIRSAIEDGQDVAVVGPPFRLLEVAAVAETAADWPCFPARSFVISAGGWKRRDNQSIAPRAFRDTLARAFRIDDASRIRDSYNMVELNSVLNECEAHRKHVPPWLEAQSRDPRTNEPLTARGLGVLGFLDPTTTSYPGFILSEDFGIVGEGRCDCGREGQTVEVVRRMNRIEARGCALKMATGADGAVEGQTRFFTSVYRSGA